MPTADQRARSTAHARKKRRERWLQEARASRTCPHRHGSGRCGALLVEHTDGTGKLVLSCPACARRLRGICRDCPRPVEGRVGSAVRCAECKERTRREQVANYVKQHREEINARMRERSQRADERARRIAYGKAYRKANPERVRLWKRREALKQGGRRLEYAERYNAMRREAKAAAMREAYYATTPAPTPTCASCARDIPWEARGQRGQAGRPPKRCVFCEARERPAVLRSYVLKWAAKDDRVVTAPAKPAVRPLRPKRRQPTRLNAEGQRLCVDRSCDQVVSGREKKCARCKQRERELALRQLGQVA